MKFRGVVGDPPRDWYQPRHPSPSINSFNDSELFNAELSASKSDRFAECWDELCDSDPDLVAWNAEATQARTGSVTWKFADTDRPAVFRRTRSRNLIVTLDARPYLADGAEPLMRQLLMKTLAIRAEMDGFRPPPDKGGWIAGHGGPQV